MCVCECVCELWPFRACVPHVANLLQLVEVAAVAVVAVGVAGGGQ